MPNTRILADPRVYFDASRLVAERPIEIRPDGFSVWAESDPAEFGVLLLNGTAVLSTHSPYGEYVVFRLTAPCLLGISAVIEGRARHTSFHVEGQAAFVRLPARQILELVLAETIAGAAIRRLTLLSASRSIRLINDGLARFFDDIASDEARKASAAVGSGNFPALRVTKPADSARINEFLSQTGLSFPILTRLGLAERTYPESARLTRTGEEGTEAFLVSAGRVRVSIRIPGVGEETLAVLEKGEIAGEMALLDDAPRSAYLTAHEGPTSVFVLSRAVFRQLLEQKAPGAVELVVRVTLSLLKRLDEAIARALSFYILSAGNPPKGEHPALPAEPLVSSEAGMDGSMFDDTATSLAKIDSLGSV